MFREIQILEKVDAICYYGKNFKRQALRKRLAALGYKGYWSWSCGESVWCVVRHRRQ
jgi:hypothetical protein